jgi:hypothetical protein
MPRWLFWLLVIIAVFWIATDPAGSAITVRGWFNALFLFLHTLAH